MATALWLLGYLGPEGGTLPLLPGAGPLGFPFRLPLAQL